MENFTTEIHVLFQALIALALGAIIGWERETAGKWAGLRTHMLVCLAAMLFVRIGQFLIEDSQRDLNQETLRMDPVRIIEAIVTGVAFIGAGTVFRDPDHHMARGLTTAASLLTVAPVGVAVAVERYFLACGATLLLFFVLRVVGRIEKKTMPHKHGLLPEKPEKPDLGSSVD